MATIGERIQRARLARGISGEALAHAVGYKQQSSIGNLENRGGGTGGKKLPEIARALRVPLSWLAEGPDDGDVPFSEPVDLNAKGGYSTTASEPPAKAYDIDASLSEAVEIFQQLRTEQRLRAITYMRELLSGKDTGPKQIGAGESDSVPHAKAA